MQNKKTRIIVTVGPSSFDKTIIQKMDSAGVDIFRINLSHTNIKDLESIIEQLKTWTSKEICIDTEGAQLRTGLFAGGSIVVKTHSIIELAPFGIIGETGKISLSVANPWGVLHPGDVLKIDFHSTVVQIIKMENKIILGRILQGGTIGSNKGISVDRVIKLPGFTVKDISAFEIAKKYDIKTVALSFASSAIDVISLRKIFDEEVFVISKIESFLGLSNLEEICRESNAILIDRGDLSRDVPIEKIAFSQQYIQKKSKELKTPVYVATNLLENMVTNSKPTRAEINDITFTLLSGANGLVLAAETAIGKYPVESVRMVARIINEVKNEGHNGDIDYLCSLCTDRIIEPHGGKLIQNYLWNYDRKSLKDLPFIEVDDEVLTDIILIAEGVYSPLMGFMTHEELDSVLNEYKLPNNVAWTLPVLLQIEGHVAKVLPENGVIGIKRKLDGKFYAIIEISEKRKILSPEKIAKKWFDTDDRNHPGVLQFFKRGEWILSGKIFLINKPSILEPHYSLTPRQTRDIFNDLGWQKIVGFYARSVIDRRYEFLQKQALKKINADAIFILPTRSKKFNEFSLESILISYQTMARNGYFDPYGMLLSTFNTYSRYSGPREVVFMAICSKNFGCSHFIIDKNHTKVNNCCPVEASLRLFDKVDIGLSILTFDYAF